MYSPPTCLSIMRIGKDDDYYPYIYRSATVLHMKGCESSFLTKNDRWVWGWLLRENVTSSSQVFAIIRRQLWQKWPHWRPPNSLSPWAPPYHLHGLIFESDPIVHRTPGNTCLVSGQHVPTLKIGM